MGLGAPLWVLSRSRFSSPPPDPPWERNLHPPVTPAMWIGVWLLAVFLRFYGLTTLSAWPMPDEGLTSFLALNPYGEAKVFLTNAQVPAGSFWIISFFYKIFPPSLFTLWLIPAFLSLLTLLALYKGVRAYFPVSFAWVLFALGASNFGFLYTGRFCESTVVALGWVVLTLAALGFWLKKRASPGGQPRLWLLGFLTGGGFFIAIFWPLAAFPVALAVARNTPEKGGARAPGFWVPTLAGAAAYAFLFLKHGAGSHIQDLWAFRSGTDWTRQALDSLRNLSAFFWGAGQEAGYGPVWGGILNPLLTSCFFFGLPEIWRARSRPWVRWTTLFFTLGLTPGLVSRNYDFFRDLAALCPLLFAAALGLQKFAASFQKRTALVLALALTGSSCLDFYHLAGPYHQTWGTPGPLWEKLKSRELYQAYRILIQESAQTGPGTVLEDLRPVVTDRTLQIAVHPFDASWNPSIPFSRVRWVSILLNADFKPFLQKKFPNARCFWVGKEMIWNQPMMLAVVPKDPANSVFLEEWAAGDRLFHPLVPRALGVVSEDAQRKVLQNLLGLEPGLSKNPLLESCFWEKVAFHRMSLHDGPGALEAVQRALQKGIPAAHLFNLEGVLLGRMGRIPEARRAFQNALRAPLNLTPARDNLEALDGLAPGKSPPP